MSLVLTDNYKEKILRKPIFCFSSLDNIKKCSRRFKNQWKSRIKVMKKNVALRTSRLLKTFYYMFTIMVCT